jgi:hypothetical protein
MLWIGTAVALVAGIVALLAVILTKRLSRQTGE